VKRRGPRWIAVTIALLIAGVGIGSYFIDPFIRARVEREMNQDLKSYHTGVLQAHLQLLDGVLTLRGVTVAQNAHPSPPVGKIPILRASIQWRELLSRRVVASFLLVQPRIHINMAQFHTERSHSHKTSLRQEGWQDALQSIYPFKINRFTVEDGSFVYIDESDPTRPLHLEHLFFDVDNIRNIHASDQTYPSPLHAETVVFGTGRARIKGHANFLEKPFPGVLVVYHVAGVPLSQFEPELRRANLDVSGGTLQSDGLAEYSPRTRRAEVYDARINGVSLTYTHSPHTAEAEQQRVQKVKASAQQVNNQPGVLLKVDHLRINDSSATYVDQTAQPNYKLYLSNLDLSLRNLSNQADEGLSTIDLHGNFMGSGKATLTGDFRPRKPTPDFDANLAIENVNLPSLNNLLLAHTNIDVQSGLFSVYSQISARGGKIQGNIKPLFGELEVYGYQKDKDKPILRQAYELVAGGAARLLRNWTSRQVATNVALSGDLERPNISSWQAFVAFMKNAFVTAISPGFDRPANQLQQSAAADPQSPVAESQQQESPAPQKPRHLRVLKKSARQPASGNGVLDQRDRDHQALTPLDQSNEPADLEITRSIRRALVADNSLSTEAKNVKVVTVKGAVTLRGLVKTSSEKRGVRADARKAAPHARIRNELEVEHD
jgi:hypothetical protein